MQLHEIRKQLRFQREFTQLVEMLKNIAGQQFHSLEREKQRFGQFMDAFSKFFRVIDLLEVDDPLVKPQVDVLGVVLLTSDSGLMGGLNNQVIARGMSLIAERAPEQFKLVTIGQKGAARMRDLKHDSTGFRGVNQATIFEQAGELSHYLVNEVLERRMGRVEVVYPQSLSFTRHSIEAIRLLPCAELFDRAAETEVAERVHHVGFIADARRVAVESDFKALLDHLVEVWVSSKLFEVFEDSKLSEFSARAIHLEGSHQKLQEELKKLKHEAFRAAHEKVDKGMREGFSAQMTKNKRRRVAARHEQEKRDAAKALE